MNIKIKKLLTFSLVCLIALNSGLIYAKNWSSYGTFSIYEGWNVKTVAGEKLGVLKNTSSVDFSVFATSKSMWTSPKFRLVNSDNAVRSDIVHISKLNEEIYGSNNIGNKGYRYYASIRPAYFQQGTDTIKLSFSAD